MVKATLMDAASQRKEYIGKRRRPRTVPCFCIERTEGGESISYGGGSEGSRMLCAQSFGGN